MLIFAILALMVSVNGYRLDYQPMGNNMLKNLCEQNGVDYDNVENSAIHFVNCIQISVGGPMFEQEMRQAESEDQYIAVFQKLCAKSPQIKTCYHKFFDVVMPCAGSEKYNVTKATKNVTDQVLDYICLNGGEPITAFVVNHGPQCFSSKQYELLTCAEHFKTTAMYLQQSMNISVALNINDELLKCITEKLETCDNPTASSFFRNVTKIVRDGFTQMIESAAKRTDTTRLPTVPAEYTGFEQAPKLVLTSDGYVAVETPPTESLPSPMSPTSSSMAYRPMSDNMMKNMCEQNGKNYESLENSAVQFMVCLDHSFEVKMLERELTEVIYEGQYKSIFQKYCARRPQLKTCYHKFFDVAIPCAGGEKYNVTKITKNVTDQVIDYVCLNGGEPITNFVQNHGEQCFENTKYGILMCAEYSKHTVMSMGPSMNLSVALNLGDKLLKCIDENLKTCDNPTASKFFANVSKIVRGGFTQVLKSADKYKGTTPEEKYLENGTQSGTATTSVTGTPPTPTNQLQTMCEQNGVDYQTVEAAVNNWTDYIVNNYNFYPLMEVQDNSTYRKLIKEYCAKSPELKTNYRAVTNAMSPCLGVSRQNLSIISINVNEEIVDYMCYNNGSRITKFFAEGGPQCLRSKNYELMQCMEDPATSSLYTKQNLNLSVTEIIDNYEIFLNCIARKLETCDRPIASEMMKTIIKISHNTAHREAATIISKPVNHTEPEESLRSKFSKMCEANGENYWSITTVRDKALTCLEDHLNMEISYQELMNAKYNGFYTKFFQRYCARKRDPYLKRCIRTFTCGVSPCLSNEAQHYLASTMKAYDQILDYVCQSYEGYFSTARAFECLENNAHEILRCAENDGVLDCTLKKLETCDSYKTYEAIGSIIRTSSLNQIKLISSYAASNYKEHHFKTSGNLVLSFNADIVV